MNWLAHLFLSAPTPEFRAGNLLPDLIWPLREEELSPETMRGVECHRAIDAYTDRHPIVRRSVGRLGAAHRRFGGVIVDVLYDHFLASEWHNFSTEPLSDYVDRVFGEFECIESGMPAEASAHLRRIHEEDLLCSYQTISGICEALRRTGGRLRKPVDLSEGLRGIDLRPFSRDFDVFFGELRAHVAPMLATEGALECPPWHNAAEDPS